MIAQTFSNRQALGQVDQFTIYIITLLNALGSYCGTVKYIRIGLPFNDVLDEAIYEAIKSRYPLSNVDYRICNTGQKKSAFKQYARHQRLYVTCRNYTHFDPAYMSNQIDSGVSVNLDVYNVKKTYIYNECGCYARKSEQEIANACNEEYSNFATYREFFQ